MLSEALKDTLDMGDVGELGGLGGMPGTSSAGPSRAGSSTDESIARSASAMDVY